jgi:hypothetical protein
MGTMTYQVRGMTRPTAPFENLSEFFEAPTSTVCPMQHDDIPAHALLITLIVPRGSECRARYTNPWYSDAKNCFKESAARKSWHDRYEFGA